MAADGKAAEFCQCLLRVTVHRSRRSGNRSAPGAARPEGRLGEGWSFIESARGRSRVGIYAQAHPGQSESLPPGGVLASLCPSLDPLGRSGIRSDFDLTCRRAAVGSSKVYHGNNGVAEYSKRFCAPTSASSVTTAVTVPRELTDSVTLPMSGL
jgi:hypothetical protein